MCLNIFLEQEFKDCPHKRLYKKHLREKCKGQIAAYKLQPVCKQREKIKPCIVGIIKPCCQKAHHRTHQSHRCTDNGGLKENRMGFLHIKNLAGKTEGTGTSDHTFQPISKGKLNENHRPDRHHPAEHIDASLCVYGLDHRIRTCHLHQSIAV